MEHRLLALVGGRRALRDRALRVLAPVIAERHAVLHDLAQPDARLHHLGREPVHLQIALVAHDQALVGVEHAQPLDHVVERGVEAGVLGAQLVAELDPGGLAPFQLGDVGARADRAAIGGPILADLNPATVDKPLLEHRAVGAAMMLDALRDVRLGAAASLGVLGALDAGAQDRLPAGSRGQVGAERVDLPEASVADHQPIVLVEQRKAVVDAFDGVAQASFGARGALRRLDLGGDVRAGAAIAEKAPRPIENRLAADPHVPDGPGRRMGKAVAEIAKRTARFEVGFVLAQLGALQAALRWRAPVRVRPIACSSGMPVSALNWPLK